MNINELVRLKIALENFLKDEISADDVFIMKQYGYIQTIPNGHELQIIYPDKQDMKKVLEVIKFKIGA